MNVKQLRNLLHDYPDEVEILLAEDPEGNGYRPLVEMSLYWIEPNSDKHGWVESFDLYDAPLGIDDGYDENFVPRLVLWP